MTLSLTSNNTSTSDELSFVDVAVRNIMTEISSYEDDTARVDLMRIVVKGLYEQLSILKERILIRKQVPLDASLMNYPNYERTTPLIIQEHLTRV